jgi:biotin---protein ligase
VQSTIESVVRLLPMVYEVCTLSAPELLAGAWTDSAALLCMPGGADLPYCKRLNGHGNKIIRGKLRLCAHLALRCVPAACWSLWLLCLSARAVLLRHTGFVTHGGAYLGLCAGAYYATERVEFEPGELLQVVGARELGLFPGIARGAVFAGAALSVEHLS